MARTLDYSILDVFAEQPLAGNPLAVFHDARSLSTEEMQALARETNLAETTFVLPEDPAYEAEHGVRVRIFTTEEEFPFAGHPTLGTATWLHLNHPTLRGAETVTLRLNVGPIPVRFAPQSSVAVGAGVVGTMRQNDPVFGDSYDAATIAPLLGLDVDDLSATQAPQSVSTGLPFCIVPLRSMEAAGRLQVDQRAASAFLAGTTSKFFYCVAPTGHSGPDDAHWHARMPFYHGEDPATGSAAGCCIAWLVQHGLAAPEVEVHIEQGIEIRRPSRITVSAKRSGERVHDVLVSGRTIPVATGRFFLP